MRWSKLMILVVLMGSASAIAQYDAWKPKSKDDFDVLVERINNGEVVEEIPAKEVIEKDPEPKEEPKPEVKLAAKPQTKKYKNLKSTPATHPDGKSAKFQEVVVFSCANIGKKRFLFNKKQTDFCHIKDVKIAAKIAEKIGTEPFKKKFATFEVCAESAGTQKTCDPKQVRNF